MFETEHVVDNESLIPGLWSPVVLAAGTCDGAAIEHSIGELYHHSFYKKLLYYSSC